MSEIGELDDDVDNLLRVRVNVMGSCQARTKDGSRCKLRAEVARDGSAYCKKHVPVTAEKDYGW